MFSKRSNRVRRNESFLLIEPLEDRVLLSAVQAVHYELNRLLHTKTPPHVMALNIASQKATPIAVVKAVGKNAASLPGGALDPAQMAAAYGINDVTFGSVTGDGAGETIAIIDAYSDPNAASDLHQFDLQYGLADPPAFQQLNQLGQSTNLPSTDPAGAGNPNGTWEVEESLDLDWAHAIAPDANIDLVEASSPTNTNLIQAAVNTARNLPGVVAVSMSFSSAEAGNEKSFDTFFTTPSGHPGVTFLAATGDTGQPGGYPAYSPDVVAVGGTTLFLNGSAYSGESGWSGSGGGISQVEGQPAYQNGVVTQSATARTIPDVSIDADPNSGVAVYDSYDFPSSPWIEVGGTSLATPMWAGLVAIADQGRAMASLNSLDGATQTLPALYKLPQADFNDITTGNNGFAAGLGYDLVTGRGTPIANVLVPALAGVQSISGSVFQDNNGDGILDSGDSPIAGATVYLDANNNGVLDPTVTVPFSSSNVPVAIRGNSTAISTLTVSGTTAPVMNISVTVNISESKDSNLTAYLVGPDGTTVILFAATGGTGKNFTNTTFSGSAATSIANGAAPFTGSFAPSPGQLYDFNNKSANGTWTLKIVDSSRSDSASLTAWSLAVTTGEISTATNSQGQFVFNSVAAGSYNLREITPTNDVQIPAAGAEVLTVGAAAVTGANFANFPTVFNDATDSDSFYLVLDATGTNLEIFNASAPLGTPTYQVPVNDLPALTFNLTGAQDSLYVDYSNGDPIPCGGLTLNGDAAGTGSLVIVGQNPSQLFLMTDTHIALEGGGSITFTPLGTFEVANATVQFTGYLSTIQNLTLDAGTTFVLQ